MNKLAFAAIATLALCCFALQASAEMSNEVAAPEKDLTEFGTSIELKSGEEMVIIEEIDDMDGDMAEKAAGGKKKAGKKGVKKPAKKGAKKPAKKGGKRPAKKGAKKPAKKGGKRPAKNGGKRPAKKAGKKGAKRN